MSWDLLWDDIFANNEWGKYPAESLIRFIARNFYKKTRKETRLLEVGCGPGGNIWYMAREGFNAYGIDGSHVAIEKASARLKAENLSANLSVGDIVALPYEDNFFDAVIDNECVYFNSLAHSRLIVDQISRVLKKDGLFFTRTFAEDCFKGNTYKIEAENEYSNSDQGPFFNRGYFRLIDSAGIDDLYGKKFDILSKEKYIIKDFASNTMASEWVLVMKKKS